VGTTLRPPELEAEYRARHLRGDGWTTAVVVGGLALLGAVYVATYARFVAPPALWFLLVARIGIVAITAAVIWAALRSRRPGVLDAWSLAWIGAGALLSAAVQSTRPHDDFMPVLSDMLLLISAWMLIPNRFRLQALGAGMATATTVTWLVALRDPPSLAATLLIGNSLLATNLAGGWVSWRFHRARRLQFLAEKELVDGARRMKESQERLQAVLDASTDGYWERDLVSGKILHSARMNELTGRPAVDTWVGPDDWTGRMHPDDLAQLGPIYGAVLSSREERFDRVFRTWHADGSWRWVRSRGKVVARDGTGRALRVAGTLTDVHAQKSAEEGLRLGEARLRSLIENLQAGVVVHGVDTNILLSNAKAGEVLGLTPEQMYGKAAIDPAWRFVRGDGATMPLEEYPVSRVLATQAPIVDQMLGIDRPATQDRAWVLVSGYPVFQGQGRLDHVVVTFVDITDRKRVEDQLLVASRLAALGTLVAGVAHEINNPLTGELAGQGVAIEEIEVARKALGSDGVVDRHFVIARLDEAIDALRDAQVGGMRIARIVKDLSLFGRPDPRRTRVRLIDVVDEAMRWLPASIPGSTTIRVENRGAPDVLASAGQIGQVLVNLVTNGAKAMADGQRGVVAIVIGPGAPGMARLEVKDDGVGMEPEVLKRIFDPFFTTRRVGQGTGLGLPICHSIVTAHGGAISASSEPGRGSTFRVDLPEAGPAA
jgi:PAS domain S-box-containing protein